MNRKKTEYYSVNKLVGEVCFWEGEMKLENFSVTNFRSITSAHSIEIKNYTIIVGKNNEGKSNLLKALNIAMRALIDHAAGNTKRMFVSSGENYQWKRDFPIDLQSRKSHLESIFRLHLSLSQNEVADFKKKIGSTLNGDLPIEIRIGKDGIPSIQVPKRGPHGPALSSKSTSIAKYVASNISFVYIPAIRTEADSISAVQQMLSQELSHLEDNEEYKNAISAIEIAQQPILKSISASIKASLKPFLPNIKSVNVSIPKLALRYAIRNQCQIEIDDGCKTRLEYKGDGVKSLAALGLLREQKVTSGAAVIAIEEPESHLHPGAMHSLRTVLMDLSQQNQLVISTHCPLFVDREAISNNIIIAENHASPAKDVASIRSVLGVMPSDNLLYASHVLIVEGEEDVIALNALLPVLSTKIGSWMKTRSFVIDSLGGAGNLSYKLSFLASILCKTHVLLDADEAGRQAFKKAKDAGLIDLSRTTFTNCIGITNAELEDCFEPAIYIPSIKNIFGVDLSVSGFRGGAKWSDRVRSCFLSQGKLWDDSIECQVKSIVAKDVAANSTASLNPHHRTCIDALVASIETLLK